MNNIPSYIQMSKQTIDYSSIRYTDEYFKPYFSNGKLSVSEVYVLLAHGFIDPSLFSPVTIFEYEGYLYSTNIRRLKIAKELQRMKKFDILKRFRYQYVKINDTEYTNQYFKLLNERLQKMKKKEFDGSTIKLEDQPSYQCCYNLLTSDFRDDLDEHIARDHLGMNFEQFNELNLYECNQCNQKGSIYLIRSPNKSNYRFMQKCSCQNFQPHLLHEIRRPRSEIPLRKICHMFQHLTETISTTNDSNQLINEDNKSYDSKDIVHTSYIYNNVNRKKMKSKKFIKEFCLIIPYICCTAILSWLILIFFK